jgi:hypothetical protein
MRLTRRAVFLAVVVLTASANFTLLVLALLYDRHVPYDWNAYAEAARRFGGSDLYVWGGEYYFRYAPISAPLLGAITGLGIGAWRVFQIVATLAFPSRVLTLLVLVSYPFFFDVNTGNLMIFVALTGFWAMRGNRIATGVYLALTVLIPRPLMLPLAVWILWKRPEWRVPFALLVTVVIISTVATGHAAAWPNALLAATDDVMNPFNFGPTGIVGPVWLLLGIPLAAWLTYRGHVGWASLAISPYLLPYYYLMLVLEWRRPHPDTTHV